jgi:butyryl-CoA dehydrogenase
MARVYADKAMSIIELSARKVIAAVAEGDMLRTQLTILRRLSKHDVADTISLRRTIAQHVIQSGKYRI